MGRSRGKAYSSEHTRGSPALMEPASIDHEDVGIRRSSENSLFGVAFHGVISPTQATPARVDAQVGPHRGRRYVLNHPNFRISGAHVPSQIRPAALFKTIRPGGSISEFYEFIKDIYVSGDRGKVVLATRVRDGSEVVVKLRSRTEDKESEQAWRLVMAHLSKICRHSKNLLDIIEICEGAKFFYIVMPCCNGGSLYELLITELVITEVECKRIIRDILSAISELHSRNLVHRDVKPENILFHHESESELDMMAPGIKLIDFDTVTMYHPNHMRRQRFVGTPGYIAPEALLGDVVPQSDLWAVGVILWFLFTAEIPWMHLPLLKDGTVGSDESYNMYAALHHAHTAIVWEDELWCEFPGARSLCQTLLAWSVEDRPLNAEAALQHDWLRAMP
eukprot:NODE_9168_length_1442_cov_8.806084.p1 GENE.NODE_9168_length_1442_cov_8.806084~~NODE_9168_length_1442_cov_8.806084.p1  ORF type:complete len:449 (+),score=60.29 NODE_9168_length_1442_cov_8.806084:173-1348(+)